MTIPQQPPEPDVPPQREPGIEIPPEGPTPDLPPQEYPPSEEPGYRAPGIEEPPAVVNDSRCSRRTISICATSAHRA